MVAHPKPVDAPLRTGRIAREHAEFAGGDDEEGVRNGVLLADGRALRDRDGVEMRDQTREGHAIQAGNDLHPPQQIALFIRAGWHGGGSVVMADRYKKRFFSSR